MWLHHASAFSTRTGVTYFVRFAGTVPIKCSMKELDFPTRCLVAQHCVAQVSHQASHIPPVSQVPSAVRKLCDGPVCLDEHSGVDLIVSIKLDQITFALASSAKVVRQHSMANISFTFSDEDQARYAALVVKEPVQERFCLVLDCGTPERARCITTTLGQAFHLRYQQAQRFQLSESSSANSSTVDTSEDSSNISMPSSTQHSTSNCSTTDASFVYNDGSSTFDVSAEITHEQVDLKSLVSQASLTLSDVSTSASSSTEPNDSAVSPIRHMTRSVAYSNLSTPLANNTPKIELEQQPWFHGPLSRFGTSLMVIQDGEFLVRASQAKRGQFVLSGMANGDLHHILLVDKDGLVRKYDGTIFESIVDLIEHHLSTQEPVISFDGVVLHLKDPVVSKLESSY